MAFFPTTHPQLSSAKRQQRAQAFAESVSHSSLERQLATLKTYQVELEVKLREREAAVEQLERDRRSISELEAKERTEKEAERAENEEYRRKVDVELRTLRNALNELREKHADSQDAYSSLSRTSKHTISTQKTQISTLTRQTELLTNQLMESQSQNTSLAAEVADLQAELDDLRSDNLKLSKDKVEADELGVVREELFRQTAYVKEMEKKNERLMSEVRVLRERQTSVEVLREEKRSLERKLSGMEGIREQAVKLEAELEVLRRERNQRSEPPNSPSLSASTSAPSISTTAALSSLRLEHAKLLEDHGVTTATLRQRDHHISALEDQLSEKQLEIQSLEKDARILKDKLNRSEKMAAFHERSANFQKDLVASYDAEASQNEQLAPGSTASPPSHILQMRVQQLEDLLSESRSTVEELRGALDEVGVDPQSGGKDVQRLRDELIDLRKDRDVLQEKLKEQGTEAQSQSAQIDALEQQLFELSGEIAGGRHVPPGVRILSMKGNPEEQWFALRQEAMDKLKSENEALMKRLRELEAQTPVEQVQPVGDPSSSHLIPRESYDLVREEVESLQSQLVQKDKRLQRLKQVFGTKSAEFREAIESIMGVKLAFYPNGQVRVTSSYDLNASFVFQPEGRGSGGGTMQLVGQGEEVSEDLIALMQTWIVKEQCIPAFVALVTLDCYEKAKAAGEI
ncbi:hypothetical protein ONZ45_g5421 [Pleurotus djamor]|nr:hypothetical protein ONZ45_g5421 [Pleurotus djamor]